MNKSHNQKAQNKVLNLSKHSLQIPILIVLVSSTSIAVLADDHGVDSAWTTDVAVDTLWVLVASMLVFFMNAGFGCIEAGFCRAKNVVNILGKNFVVFGNNNLSNSSTSDLPAGVVKRSNRIWHTDKTGTVNSAALTFDIRDVTGNNSLTVNPVTNYKL